MSDKLELLDEIDSVINPNQSIDLNFLLQTLVVILFVLAVVFPKIYIQQQIYFTSRDITKTKDEYDNLREENRLIAASVESIRFKNQVLDTLF